MPTRDAVDVQGAAWGGAAFAASLLIGVGIEPFRRTVGLENVVPVYLLVVILTAAAGGRLAGLIAAVSAALSYDFFLTTPYHQLVIDSASQVITVGLLLATGVAASLVGRARRRLTLAAGGHAALLRLLNTVAATAASGGNPDRVAAEGIRQLLGARRVAVHRATPDGVRLTVDVGADAAPLDVDDLPHLDQSGHVERPRRPAGAGMVRWIARDHGAVLDLVHLQRRVGRLVVVLEDGRALSPVTRTALATIADTLAMAGPAG
jgi:K+-sensing histidine kinase KdpD